MEHKDYTLEIILELIKGQNHIRGLAQLLKVNHMNILRKVNFLLKNNVVDYKLEGKNKTYFLKETIEARSYIFLAENYKILTLLEKYPLLRNILAKIQKNDKIKMAILFGSFAKGIANEKSDIDIYVETNDKKIKKELESIDSRLSIKIGEFSKENLLIKEIIKNHVIIKGIEEYYEKNKLFS
jgi:predicted nucleotidyltransferase